MDIELQTTEITTETIEITVPTVEVCTGDEDIELVVTRKEFNVIGDSIYIGNRIDDTPQWLMNYIDSLNALSLDDKISDINGLSQSLEDLIDAMNVAKNAYESAIITYEELELMVNAKIETLNSTLSGSDANIINILSTKATPTEAQSIATQVLDASIDGGRVKALVGSVQQAIANESTARANDISVLTAELFGIDGDVYGIATAVETLEAKVVNEVEVTIASLQGEVNALSNQIDGVVETIIGTQDIVDINGNITLVAEPYASWVLEGTVAQHTGDTYIKTLDGAYVSSWKFAKGSIDVPFTDFNGYAWYAITDSMAIAALEKATQAYDISIDNKRRVFIAQPTTAQAYDVGDLWAKDDGTLWKCIIAKVSGTAYSADHWTLAITENAFNSFFTDTYSADMAEISQQVDKKAETFYTPSMPHPEKNYLSEANAEDAFVNDLWYNSIGDRKTYRYTKEWNGLTLDDIGSVTDVVITVFNDNGLVAQSATDGDEYGSTLNTVFDNYYYYKWEEMPVPSEVFDKIDGKKTIYTAKPTSYEVDDIWIPSITVDGKHANEVYIATKSNSVYDANDWVTATKYTDDTAVTTLATGLANGSVSVDIKNARVGDTTFSTYLVGEIDKKVGVYSGQSAPVSGQPDGVLENDIYLWFTTTQKKLANGETVSYDITKTYKYVNNSWDEITTNENISALADLADGKRTIFSGSVVPTGAVERDVWIPSADVGVYKKGEVYQYLTGSWVTATKYTEDLDSFVNVVNPKLNKLENQADKQVEYYFIETEPTWDNRPADNYLHHNDVWFKDSTNEAKVYNYIIDEWVDAPALAATLQKIADTKEAADGKVTMYSVEFALARGTDTSKKYVVVTNVNNAESSTATSVLWSYVSGVWTDLATNGTVKYGDLVTGTRKQLKIGTTNTYDDVTVTYKWNSAWADLDGRITSATKWAIDLESEVEAFHEEVYGTSGLESTLTTAIEQVGANTLLTAQSKFAYNSALVIGSQAYNSGFGITSTGSTGTNVTVDGINYPLWNSEFWIKADNFKMVAASQTAAAQQPFSVNAATGDITFNGKVSFSSISDSGTYIPTISSVTTAQSTANSKPNVYYQATAPSSVGRVLGDLWFDSDDKNQPYRWSGSAWVSIRDLSITDASTAASAANTAALNAMTAAQAAQATADGAIRTFYQASAPTGLNATTDIGDMWFDTDDNQAYRWNGSVWTVIEDNSIAVALAAAQNAQTTADGKIAAFYQTGAPATGMETGDIWYDTDDNNKVYYYTGAAWSTLRDGTIAIAQTAANSAQTTANTASTNATAALNKLTDLASDNLLSPVEKPSVIAQRDVIIAEQSGIDAQAVIYGITIEKTAYDTAVSELVTYLATLTSPVLWSNVAGDTTIVGSTFRSKFNTVYTARQTLLNAVYAKAKVIADSKATLTEVAAVGYVLPDSVAAAVNSNTTTIDGSKITTGSIAAAQIAAGTITADKINAGVLYNIGGNSSNYSMMINFNTGEIHIR